MKLNNFDRNAFIQAVIDDVPIIDYDAKCRSLIMKWAVGQMPEHVAIAYKKNPEYFKTSYVGTPGSVSSMYAPVPENIHSLATDAPELFDHLSAVSDLIREQNQKISDLRTQLKGAIFACTTLKKAKEMLPEFEKYLPADRDGQIDRSMPMISNLVATLVEAGWPKSQGASA